MDLKYAPALEAPELLADPVLLFLYSLVCRLTGRCLSIFACWNVILRCLAVACVVPNLFGSGKTLLDIPAVEVIDGLAEPVRH